jgi:hypothetical protein
MIVAVAMSIYLPGVGKRPAHNFLYMTGISTTYGYPGAEYAVSGGHLVHNELTITPQPGYPYPAKISPSGAHFYVYNVGNNIASEVAFDEAQKYTLDPSNASSDGYMVERGNGGGGFLFGGSADYNSWFIKGYNRSTKLNLKFTGTDYYNFQFLGWIE